MIFMDLRLHPSQLDEKKKSKQIFLSLADDKTMLAAAPIFIALFYGFGSMGVGTHSLCVFYSLLLKQGQSQCAGGNSLSVSQEAFAAPTQHFPSLVSCSCLLSADTVFTVLHSLIP